MSAELPRGVHLGSALCGDLVQAERREWWLANGLGGYAAGTVAGSLTRRYHGLLIAPLEPPLGRRLVLAKADATLIDGDREWPLFANRWSDGTVCPSGRVHMESFELEGRVPVWRFAIGDLRLEQRIWLEPGANTSYVAWCLAPGFLGTRPLRLRATLLVNDRDHHGNDQPGGFEPVIEPRSTPAGEELRVGLPFGRCLKLIAPGGNIAPARGWYQRRGLGARRRLPPGHGLGLAARTLRARGIPGPRRCRPCPGLARADRRPPARRGARHRQRDLRGRPAAPTLRGPEPGLVGRLCPGGLDATGAGETMRSRMRRLGIARPQQPIS